MHFTSTFSRTRRLLMLAGFGLTVALPLGAKAQTVTVVTDPATWRQSTVVETANANDVPWPGIAEGALPDLSTYTLVPGLNGNAVDITGAAKFFSATGVRFYHTTFTLPSFSSIATTVQASVDNDVDIFINGKELAATNPLSASTFSPPPMQLTVDTNGNITNGANGGQAFNRISSSFPSTRFLTGTNHIVLAVRNLNGGDTGGVSFRADFQLNGGATAPEPGSLALSLVAVLSGSAILVRRKKR